MTKTTLTVDKPDKDTAIDVVPNFGADSDINAAKKNLYNAEATLGHELKVKADGQGGYTLL
jgi:hypothetical protein